ncbi:MAG: hypothetical protein ACI8RD_013783, partial [Bacillariaceae sp.]
VNECHRLLTTHGQSFPLKKQPQHGTVLYVVLMNNEQRTTTI